MYSIGQFAVMTKIPAKTLRYYDEIDLLPPARVDYSNSYRYYDEESLLRAQQVLIYRSCGLPLEKIRELLEQTGGSKDLKSILTAQLTVLDRKIEEIQAIRSVIQTIIQSLEENEMEEVTVTQREARTVLSVRERGTHDSIGALLSRLFDTAAESGLQVTGSHTIVWYEDRDFTRDSIDMEICIPVDSESARQQESPRRPELLTEKGAQTFCETLHRGSLATLSSAHARLRSYIDEHGLTAIGPVEESFLSRMGFVKPSEMEVRVAIPIETVM